MSSSDRRLRTEGFVDVQDVLMSDALFHSAVLCYNLAMCCCVVECHKVFHGVILDKQDTMLYTFVVCGKSEKYHMFRLDGGWQEQSCFPAIFSCTTATVKLKSL